MITRTKANSMLYDLIRSVSGSNTTYYWIGLSTTTPDVNGNNFTEPVIPEGAVDDDGQAITVNEYQRVSLADIMGTPSNAIIKNDAIIFFNEAEHYPWAVDGTKIMAFGVFEGKSATSYPKPIFWGEIKNTDGTVGVEVPQNHIPIFRAGKLQIGLDQDPANPV